MRVAYLTPLLLVPMLSAQDFRATLNGRVTDPHNAAIAGAVVLLRDVEKSETLRQTTDHEGNYVFTLIQPGNYELTVTHPGFKNHKRSGLTLNVNQTPTHNHVILGTANNGDATSPTNNVPATAAERTAAAHTLAHRGLGENERGGPPGAFPAGL